MSIGAEDKKKGARAKEVFESFVVEIKELNGLLSQFGTVSAQTDRNDERITQIVRISNDIILYYVIF